MLSPDRRLTIAYNAALQATTAELAAANYRYTKSIERVEEGVELTSACPWSLCF